MHPEVYKAFSESFNRLLNPLEHFHHSLYTIQRIEDFQTLAIWDSIILSPQYAINLDKYFEGDVQHLTFLQLYHTTDMLLCNQFDIAQYLPGATLSIKLNTQCIKNLASLLISKEKMDAAVESVVTKLNDEATKDVPGIGKFYLPELHFGITHDECFRITDPTIPTCPNTPEQSRSPSPIPIPDKGKERAIPTNEEEPTDDLYEDEIQIEFPGGGEVATTPAGINAIEKRGLL